MRLIIIIFVVCGLFYLIFYNYYKSRSPENPTIHVTTQDNNIQGFCGNATSDGFSRFFKQNCATCHHAHKLVIGPALHETMKKYTPEWLMVFINNPDSLKIIKDSGYNFLIKKYGHEPHKGLTIDRDNLTIEIAEELRNL